MFYITYIIIHFICLLICLISRVQIEVSPGAGNKPVYLSKWVLLLGVVGASQPCLNIMIFLCGSGNCRDPVGIHILFFH